MSSSARRRRVIASVVIAILVLILLLLLKCRTKETSGASADGADGQDSVIVEGGGGSGKRGGGGGGGKGGGKGNGGGGGSGNAVVEIKAGSGGGADVKGGGGAGGGEPVPGGSGAGNGELVIVGGGGGGGGSAEPDQLAAGGNEKPTRGDEFQKSRLEASLARVTREDFTRVVRSAVKGDPARNPVPRADTASVELQRQTPSKEWERIEISIIDVPWNPIVVGKDALAKAKASGQPVISWQDGKRFYRASYIGANPVEENWDGAGSTPENKLTFAVAGRWQVFVHTRNLPDDVAGTIARQVDIALLETLAKEIPAGTP